MVLKHVGFAPVNQISRAYFSDSQKMEEFYWRGIYGLLPNNNAALACLKHQGLACRLIRRDTGDLDCALTLTHSLKDKRGDTSCSFNPFANIST